MIFGFIKFIAINFILGLAFGGEWIDASWSDYPFMARLDVRRADGNYICGGSIISLNEWNGKGVILTAAHCVLNAININVGIGCTHTNCNDYGAKWYADHYYIIHPEYNPSLEPSNIYWSDNDIALIFLQEGIDNYGAKKIELCTQDMSTLENDAAIKVFGYYGSCAGQPVCIGGSDLDTLEYANTNFMISSECDDIYGQSVTGPHDFCIRDDQWLDGRQGVCMGDSGSPLVYNDKQIGLNSWGPGSCDPRYPTVATSIPYYYQWIASECPQCCGIFKSMSTLTSANQSEEIQCNCQCQLN